MTSEIFYSESSAFAIYENLIDKNDANSKTNLQSKKSSDNYSNKSRDDYAESFPPCKLIVSYDKSLKLIKIVKKDQSFMDTFCRNRISRPQLNFDQMISTNYKSICSFDVLKSILISKKSGEVEMTLLGNDLTKFESYLHVSVLYNILNGGENEYLAMINIYSISSIEDAKYASVSTIFHK